MIERLDKRSAIIGLAWVAAALAIALMAILVSEALRPDGMEHLNPPQWPQHHMVLFITKLHFLVAYVVVARMLWRDSQHLSPSVRRTTVTCMAGLLLAWLWAALGCLFDFALWMDPMVLR